MKGIALLMPEGKAPKGKLSSGDEPDGDESPAQVLADMLGVDDADALVRALKAALKGSAADEEG